MIIQRVKGFFTKILEINNKIFEKIESSFSSLLLLFVRLWMAKIFFVSGRNKLLNMDNTIYLFEYDYLASFEWIYPVIPAYTTTFAELICSIFLAFGILTRFATLPLIIITLVIQLIVIQNHEHYYWLILLALLFIKGSGRFSVDKSLKIK